MRELRNEEKRGEEAEKLLKNPTLMEAFETMKSRAIEEIEKSDIHEREKREELFRFYKSIELVNKELKAYLTRGKNATYKLTEVLKHVS